MIFRIAKLFNLGPLVPTKGEQAAAHTRCPPGWRWIKTVGSFGQALDEQWEFKLPTERFSDKGVDRLPTCIEKLLSTKRHFAELTVFDSDEDGWGVMVYNQEGEISLEETYSGPELSDAEKQGRSIAAEYQLANINESRAPHGSLTISWLLPSDPAIIYQILNRFLIEVREIPSETQMRMWLDGAGEYRPICSSENRIDVYITYPIEDPTAPPPIG